MENSNLKILFINTFLVLFIAGTSSVHRLQLDLIEVETTLQNVCTTIPLVPEMINFVLSCFVIAKFCFSYASLAAHVIAFFPILNYDLSDLLMPTIILQLFQNVIFNAAELSMGYFACRYYLTNSPMACYIFYFKMMSKIMLSLIVLNTYWNFYCQLREPRVNTIPTREFLKQLSSENPLNHTVVLYHQSQ